MFKSPFFRKLFIPYLLLTCIAIAVVGLFAGVRLRSSYMDSRRQALHEVLGLSADLLRDDILAGRWAAIGERIKPLGKQIGGRITLIAADGKVLADNWADPATMENHGQRPEVVAATRAGEAYAQRTSDTIHDDLLYLARHLEEGGTGYYLRVALRIKPLDHELHLLYGTLAAIAIAGMVAAGLIVYQFARRHAAPIVELTDVARALGKGELDRRAQPGGGGEAGTLARTLNSMADSIQGLLAQAAKDKAELLTILSSMSEGVIATDAEQRILVVNAAAGQLLDFDPATVQGRPLWQVVTLEKLIKASADVLASGQRMTFETDQTDARHLEICACTYPNGAVPQGLVIVAHDTTQSVRYQELRKEFVANVSHELRTPLTVIKGFVETLLDGAMNDPVKGREYLQRIERHTNQLTNLVADLLELSKLESQPEAPRRTQVDISAAVRRTAELLLPAAQKKSQTLTVDAGRVPAVTGNPDYLERAVANLVDNAIKYTPEGGRINVTARASNGSVIVEVADNGIGIPKEDLPRIFERFYRVDRSRSREMGGTGLGLSIVKHIAQSHGGAVEVTSVPGEGSTFRLKLPVGGVVRPFEAGGGEE